MLLTKVKKLKITWNSYEYVSLRRVTISLCVEQRFRNLYIHNDLWFVCQIWTDNNALITKTESKAISEWDLQFVSQCNQGTKSNDINNSNWNLEQDVRWIKITFIQALVQHVSHMSMSNFKFTSMAHEWKWN